MQVKTLCPLHVPASIGTRSAVERTWPRLHQVQRHERTTTSTPLGLVGLWRWTVTASVLSESRLFDSGRGDLLFAFFFAGSTHPWISSLYFLYLYLAFFFSFSPCLAFNLLFLYYPSFLFPPLARPRSSNARPSSSDSCEIYFSSEIWLSPAIIGVLPR